MITVQTMIAALQKLDPQAPVVLRQPHAEGYYQDFVPQGEPWEVMGQAVIQIGLPADVDARMEVAKNGLEFN